MKRLLIVLILALVFSSIALAQNFSGKYVLESGEGDTVLSVQQDAQGKVQGTLEFDDGTTFQLGGEIKNNEAIGIASNQANTNLFKLRFQGGQLIYTIIAIGPDGNPDLANVQEFPFTRQGGGEAPGRAGPMTAAPAAPGTAASGHSFAGTYSVSTSSVQAEGVTRDDVSVNRRILRTAFKLGKPERDGLTFGGVEIGKEDYAVVAVSRIEYPITLNDEDIDKTKSMLLQSKADEEWSSVVDELKEKASISIYSSRL